MIVARPKIGTRVRPKTDWNMLDPEVLSWHLRRSTPIGKLRRRSSFVLRQMVEPGGDCARGEGALPRHDRPDRGRLSPHGAVQRSALAIWIGADLDFHMGILEATGNHFLTALGGLILHPRSNAHSELSWEERIADTGRSPASAPRHSRGHTRQLAGTRQDPDDRTAQRLD